MDVRERNRAAQRTTRATRRMGAASEELVRPFYRGTILAAMSRPRDERAPSFPSSPYETLATPPRIGIELLREIARSGEGFLQVREVELRNRYADAAHSAAYRYFFVERRLLDAVALVLYRRSPNGPELILRSQLRPPLHFRADYDVPIPAVGTGAVQWEIPAGLVEQGEHGSAGLFARAREEAEEEVGLILPATRFRLLGQPTSLSPGLIAEKLHFVAAEVLREDPQCMPTGDGHPVEERSQSVFVSLPSALRAIDEGLVHDIKTEVGIRRLAALIEASS